MSTQCLIGYPLPAETINNLRFHTQHAVYITLVSLSLLVLMKQLYTDMLILNFPIKMTLSTPFNQAILKSRKWLMTSLNLVVCVYPGINH